MIAFVGTGVVDLTLLPARATELLARASRVIAEPSLVAALTPHAPLVVESAELGALDLVALRGDGDDVVVRVVRGEVMRRAANEVRRAREAGHAVIVVPAVSAAGAAAAFAGVELSPGVRVIEGSRAPEGAEWMIVHPGTPRQRVLARADVSGDAAEDDAAWIVGGAPDPALRWFDTQPLFGKRIVVTRAAKQAGSFAQDLRERGAEPVMAPAIEIHPPSDPEPLARAVADLARDAYGWVAFTSANGVESFGAELARQSLDARAFGRSRIAVIGPGTAAALAKLGLRADVVAPEHVGESLAAAVLEASARAPGPHRLLLPRAKIARDVAPELLRAGGFAVDIVPVYETRAPVPGAFADLARQLDDGAIDAVTFTSTSTVTHLLAALGADAPERAAERLGRAAVASIGPVTTAACVARGVRVDVTAAVYTISGLTLALEGHFSSARGR